MSGKQEDSQPSLFKFFKKAQRNGINPPRDISQENNAKVSNLPPPQLQNHVDDVSETKKRSASPPSTPPPISTKRRRLTTNAKSVDADTTIGKTVSRFKNRTLFGSDDEEAGEAQNVSPVERQKSSSSSTPAPQTVSSIIPATSARGPRCPPKGLMPVTGKSTTEATSQTSKSAVRKGRKSTPMADPSGLPELEAETLWQLDSVDTPEQEDTMSMEDTEAKQTMDLDRLCYNDQERTVSESRVLPTQEVAMEMLQVDSSYESSQDELQCMNFYLYQCPVSQGVMAVYWRAFIEAYYAYKDIYCFPSWINPKEMRDQKNRKADDPEFELNCIWVPASQKESRSDKSLHFTPALMQFWEVKRDYFDKIVFFKLGKFYEIFYTDACIMQALCDLKWMGHDEKAHVGFPEVSLHTYAQKAVNAGFSVTVVEQMETPQELKERQQNEEGVKPKAVKREICEIYSQGTIAHHDMIGPESNYLVSLNFQSQSGVATNTDGNENDHSQATDTDEETLWHQSSIINIGRLRNTLGAFSCVLVDVAGSKIFYLNQLDETPNRPALRTLLSHSNPREVLLSKANLPSDVLYLLETMPQKPSISYIPRAGCVSAVLATAALREHFVIERQDLSESKPDVASLLKCCAQMPSLRLAMLGCCEYLSSLFLKEKVLWFSSIKPWVDSSVDHPRLCLDATAMRALEVLASSAGKKEGSLLHDIDQCRSAYGSRLLRQWLIAPLVDVNDIQERLNSVEWLIDNMDLVRDLREILAKLPDLERLTSRISSQAIQVQRGAVYFTDTLQKKMTQFVQLLDSFVQAEECSHVLHKYLQEVDSQPNPLHIRFCRLLSRQETGGLFPDLSEQIQSIRSYFTYDDKMNIVPVPKSFPEYDAVIQEISEADRSIRLYAKERLWTEELQMPIPKNDLSSIRFVDVKFKYELEVPEGVWKEVAKKKRHDGADVRMTSCQKSVVRFQSSEMRSMAFEIALLEARKQEQMIPFVQSLYKAFHDRSDFFLAATAILAEVDIYCCFAHTASNWAYGPYSRPRLLSPEMNSSRIKICKGYHPVVCKRVNYVPNDFNIGNDTEPCRTMVITGPNMGGKSTLARQVALLAIMAQIGSYVPAEQFEFVPLDRIFTRVGAYDSILEGKSTFYVELEEVDSFLRYATSRTLGILDEFGRGTSIEEGSALALATVKYIAEELKCLCLFSTHFQHQFEKHLLGDPLVAFYHMAFTADENSKQLVFLYKFLEGLCPKSHGLKVARLAGVPDEIMDDADQFLTCALQKH